MRKLGRPWNVLPHWSHLNGFRPVCNLLTCPSNWARCKNSLPQYLHWYGFRRFRSSSCVSMCGLKFTRNFPQTRHSCRLAERFPRFALLVLLRSFPFDSQTAFATSASSSSSSSVTSSKLWLPSLSTLFCSDLISARPPSCSTSSASASFSVPFRTTSKEISYASFALASSPSSTISLIASSSIYSMSSCSSASDSSLFSMRSAISRSSDFSLWSLRMDCNLYSFDVHCLRKLLKPSTFFKQAEQMDDGSSSTLFNYNEIWRDEIVIWRRIR